MISRASDWLSGLTHKEQQNLAIAVDCVLCVFASWLAIALRMGILSVASEQWLTLSAIALGTWTSVAWFRGVYLSILRYSGGRTMVGLAVAGTLMAAIMSVIIFTLRLDSFPRTVSVLQPIIFVGLLGASRLFVRFVMTDLPNQRSDPFNRRVLIYGAGRAGQQLELSLRHEKHIQVAAYLDDDLRMRRRLLDGLRVHHPSDLPDLMAVFPIDEILLALPKIGRARRREIVESLKGYPVVVRTLPSTAKIIADEVSINDLRPVSIDDLLGRDLVPADEALLDRALANKCVLVTGAGGSIGSELCRQILSRAPRRLVLIEQSEFALYQIEDELRDRAIDAGIELITELGSVADRLSVERLFARWQPETVFHAAAYKHVPLVEKNPIAGAYNNIFSTLYLCEQAKAAGVERFVLVSTDKAVRPTNIMGATKRVCEQILQAHAAEGGDTCFSMVRFGNVLGSSGSVVPKFAAQIAAGGPVTVTAKDVTRYFMTIPEAAELVIQAGAMADGGDVFVLDMGEPIKIFDLARAMIELSGLTVRDADHQAGDIEIVEIGLRPGEKRFEELLIGSNPNATAHPRIIKAHEAYMAWSDLRVELERLCGEIRRGDQDAVVEIIGRIVPDHRPERL